MRRLTSENPVVVRRAKVAKTTSSYDNLNNRMF